MTRTPWTLLSALSALLLLGAVACSSSSGGLIVDGDEPDGDEPEGKIPYVVVSGNVAIRLGETGTLTAQTVNGADDAYEWASDDIAVATVDENGVVTGTGLGTALITATGGDTGKTGAWGVYIYDETISNTAEVSITGPVAVQVGETATLEAETKDGTDASYTWSSSETAVATVDENGVVTGVYEGEVLITATGDDTGKTGTWGMYVYAPPVVIPEVFVTGGFSVKVGETLQLEAETNRGTDSGYTWSTSDDEIATVDADGLVTGVAAGEVIISAVGADTQVGGTIGITVLAEEGVEAPFVEMWSRSAHANATSESFRHWDADGSIPAGCAKCHSTFGFLDFLGEDGSVAGEVNEDAALGSVVSCVACHNGSTVGKDGVTFPSGLAVAGLGKESVCMECHQGRESAVSVDAALTAAELADDDTPNAALGFKNIHYAAAGVVQFGAQAKGGYEYTGKVYDRKFEHVAGVASCTTCHDPHTLEIKENSCSQCHAEDNYKDIRMFGSRVDYDGDGNRNEGIYYEIDGLKATLYTALQAYARDVIETSLIYDGNTYPYFFIDTNDNGEVDDGEATFANRYTAWTGRLVKATYNFQFAKKDAGGFAHNAKYLIQLLTDSIEDLNTVLDTPVGSAAAVRNDSGHFDGTTTAWRRWDTTGTVQSSCARCHSSEGLPFYLTWGLDAAAPASNGMACSTCHDDLTDFSVRTAASVKFPGGATLNTGDNTSNLCMTCHQGRESMASVNTAIGTKPLDTVDATLSFRNVHYAHAGAVRQGRLAQVGYMYTGKTYDGAFGHVEGYTECADCHGIHTQQVKVSECASCHEGVTTVEDLQAIRMAGSVTDYDGDGNVTESKKDEIDGLLALLYAGIQAYAADHPDAADIVYDADRHPYFFNADTNQNYATWTPRLLKAAFNYQFVKKDHGAYAHNPGFAIQLLVDSLEDLGGDVSALSRASHGHFNSTSPAFRNWDGTGTVTAGCARCHTNAGFRHFAETGTDPTQAMPTSAALACSTCHSDLSVVDGALTAPVRYIAQVTFPGGAQAVNNAETPNNSILCISCHAGRTGKGPIDDSIAANNFRFLNVHYKPAGGVQYGTDAKVGYEYAGKTYETKFTHVNANVNANCNYCHKVTGDAHAFEVSCVGCHGELTPANVTNMRSSAHAGLDYDGDGSATEALSGEVSTLAAALWAEIQTYALDVQSAGITYDGSRHPYFFNAAGTASYASWNAALMKAAHNYQIYKKDPGAWAHNGRYVIQLLIDSIEDLGGDVSGYTRPE